jgi:hypothetical protein
MRLPSAASSSAPPCQDARQDAVPVRRGFFRYANDLRKIHRNGESDRPINSKKSVSSPNLELFITVISCKLLAVYA